MEKKTSTRRRRSKKVNTCRQATSLILDYITGEMEPELVKAFEEHLSICPDCVAFLTTYKKTIQFVQSVLEKKTPKFQN